MSPHSSPQPPASSPVLCSHGKPKSFLLLFTLLPAARRARCPDPGPQQAGIELGTICASAGAGAVLVLQLPGCGGQGLAAPAGPPQPSPGGRLFSHQISLVLSTSLYSWTF